jgi:hypothetical protein
MGEIVSDFIYTHVFGMAFVMKEDVVFDVVDVGLFGAEAHVFEAHKLADLI